MRAAAHGPSPFVLGTHGGELVYEIFERRQVLLQTWIVYAAPLVDVGASQAIILVIGKMICALHPNLFSSAPKAPLP